MLNPNRPIALLPQDRQIMQLTGMSEKEYRFFVRQTVLHSKLRPGEPTAFLNFVVALVIGIALSYVASLLAPKPRQQEASQPETRDVQGQNLVNGARYTPKTGFDSVQNVVELGSVVPLVYANRQRLDGISYGGVRVNTNLLWSQIYSIGGGQLLRAVFLVSEAEISALDPTQFAIGNNLISGYDLERRDAGRICLYFSPDGGRLTGGDYIAGVEPSGDEGNAENAGGGDVFQVRGPGDEWTTDFCYASTPSNQVVFGLYGFIGNNLPFRVNPVFRTMRRVEVRPDGEINCAANSQERVNRRKQDKQYAGRVGVIRGGNVNIGDTVELNLYSSTDADQTFSDNNAEVSCGDVGQAVSSRQRSVDEQLNLGDLYRIGSALGICISRTNQAFVSDADNQPIGGGTSTSAIFEIVRPGFIHTYSSGDLQDKGGFSATERSHLMQAAEANVTTERQGKIVELGFRSQMQVNISGLCNFVDGRNYERIDDEACDNYDGQDADDADLINFNSGTYSAFETRYSFFRIAYRTAGTNEPYTDYEDLFGIRSTTGVAVYNYLRFEFPEAKRWEIRITPISGWEVRNNIQPGALRVLDPHYNNIITVSNGDISVRFTGETVSRSRDTFAIESLNARKVVGDSGSDGNYFADDYDGTTYGYMSDAWARLAEGFIFSEITATTTQPEHRIVYINTVSENEQTPEYENLAIVGMNIRASKEISSLSQFSVYVNQGINATSNFPEVLYDLLTNDRYGTGQVLNPRQIDKLSFDDATVWASQRRYFFDGAVSERVNLRSWGAAVASNFLLDFVVRNGKFALQPVANFDGPEEITGLFTAGNIIEDSFQLSYTDAQDRIRPRISVIWREEREVDTIDSKGLFPVVREVSVREGDTPEDAPLEKIDISDYATSERHAIDRAKWECLVRRYVTHTVTFKTTPTEAALDIGAVFKLGMETINYNQPQNGAIAENGEVTSWPPLADGSYPVLLWDGKTQAIQETTITVSGGKSSPASSVFCLRNSISDVQTYKTQSLSFDEDGNIDVVATYFPTDASSRSEMVNGFSDNNFVIEGRLSAYSAA